MELKMEIQVMNDFHFFYMNKTSHSQVGLYFCLGCVDFKGSWAYL